MHDFAAGSAGPVGLAGSEPPLSTETIGRAPSFLEAPVPLQAVPPAKADEEIEFELDGPVESPVQMPVLLPTRPEPTATTEPSEATGRRRVVMRLVGEQELELGLYDERESAVERAKTVIAAISAAERAGEWPELDGRHLRPAAILSVDILVEDG